MSISRWSAVASKGLPKTDPGLNKLHKFAHIQDAHNLATTPITREV